MSGRNYRQLVKLHRESTSGEEHEENLKALSKLADTNLPKYKQVKYDLLRDFIGERKEAAKNSLEKVKKLEECSKAKKEMLFMKQHKYLWFKELNKLNSLSKKYQDDLDDYLKLLQTAPQVEYVDMRSDDENEEYYDDDGVENCDEITHKLNTDEIEFINEHSHIDELEKFKFVLDIELDKFKKSTLEPIYNLNEDLKYYLAITPNKEMNSNNKHEIDIKNMIEQVKYQQEGLIDKLNVDFMNLVDEINMCSESMMGQNSEFISISEGIPYQAYLLESPDDELKLSVLNEFIIIDFKYKEKLKQLNENYKSISEQEREYDGWAQYEHEIFQHIYEQYQYHNVNLTNCNFTLRDLMFDRMKRTFELYDLQLSRAELVKHEEWMNTSKYYNQQQKLIYNEWNESRKGLLVKAEAIFQEAFEMIEIEREKKSEREKQLRICNELYAKVKKYREQKLEALEIQQKLDKIMEEERRQKIKIENEREKKRRENQKQNINEYHERLETEKELIQRQEAEKLENLKKQLQKQAVMDKERIEFRKKLVDERNTSFQQKKLAEKQELEMKEKRIEKFLDSVKPNIEYNPARLMSFTLSELSRRGVNITKEKNELSNETKEEKFQDKKQLYNVYSFTDKQLNNDARLRIEARLRQAGLINNDYAREMIKHVKPPTMPRRDTMQNSNWHGFTLDSNANKE